MTVAELTGIPLRHLRRGKVREVYVVDDDRLLLVATDRISAFDVVMAEAIPHKGAVLTQITAWWLRHFESLIHHHMLSANVDEIIADVPSLADHRTSLVGRAMLCRRTDVFPSPVPRGKSIAPMERSPARRCPAGCARASVSSPRSSARRRRRSRDTTRTSRSIECRRPSARRSLASWSD
jgi:SAICAR synthetase